jgi:hypothetical protein
MNMFWYNRIKRAKNKGQFTADDYDNSTWRSDAVAEISGIPRDDINGMPIDDVLVNLQYELDDALEVDAIEGAFTTFNKIQDRIKELGMDNPEWVLQIDDLTPYLTNTTR